MKNVLKARKSGFTLVELLIVIIIIAILAGMMMLATGAATDTAEATRIINDLRATKAAGILLYMDEGQEWDWADISAQVTGDTLVSFDRYMDRPLFQGNDPIYDLYIRNNVTLQDGSNRTTPVTLIGFDLAANSNSKVTPSVQEKLARNAQRIGLYTHTGQIYAGGTGGTAIYMILH